MRYLKEVIREIITELKSPSGDSREEINSDVDEIIRTLENIASDLFSVDPSLSVAVRNAASDLIKNKMNDPRRLAVNLTDILDIMRRDLDEETLGLQMRLETLLRRLPQTGSYDVSQSPLNPPFDPSKAGRFNTT
jgi:hypothetical protein